MAILEGLTDRRKSQNIILRNFSIGSMIHSPRLEDTMYLCDFLSSAWLLVSKHVQLLKLVCVYSTATGPTCGLYYNSPDSPSRCPTRNTWFRIQSCPSPIVFAHQSLPYYLIYNWKEKNKNFILPPPFCTIVAIVFLAVIWSVLLSFVVSRAFFHQKYKVTKISLNLKDKILLSVTGFERHFVFPAVIDFKW